MLSSYYKLSKSGATKFVLASWPVIGTPPMLLNIRLIIRQAGGKKVTWSLRHRAEPSPPVKLGNPRRRAGGGLTATGTATATAGSGGGGGGDSAERAAKPQILIKIQHIIFKKVRQLEGRWLAH